ncbi:beta-lactamase family protein [Venturia nashicola]|nr:beta-lactamase family protein [Venturia nashicola]
MRLSPLSFIAILLHSAAVNSNFLGPQFSPPTHFASDSLVAENWKNLGSKLDAYVRGYRQGVASSLLEGLENLTFSLGMFSIYDPTAESLQYHYTSDEVAKGIPAGGEAVWGVTGGISVSSGGLLSSLNDMVKFGTAILNSTLLPEHKTRQWLKPISHSSQFEFSIGMPWEIYRHKHADTGAITDIYTKLGDSGNYTGFMCLVPDYDVGFTVLTAGSNGIQKSVLASTIADLCRFATFCPLLVPWLSLIMSMAQQVE